MPPGGDGVYYFSIYVYVDDGEYGRFDMTLNDDVICSTFPDHNNSGAGDFAPGSCSAVVQVVAGKQLNTVYQLQKQFKSFLQLVHTVTATAYF